MPSLGEEASWKSDRKKIQVEVGGYKQFNLKNLVWNNIKLFYLLLTQRL